ncbi:hypothetical protein [Pedobacter antarcticus]|uniref:hypothetical protein n=1 Tax=Pedobacter antarcticus TaxID=34086 RepID=UPI001C565D1C|nr:hypothetical protein [Pedobacter antarcticus]
MEKNPELNLFRKICLRVIILTYLLLFAMAAISSIYLLKNAMQQPPVSALVFFKYILLAIVFSLLFLRAFFAVSLHIEKIRTFATSTRNFKWLFGISALLAIGANFGWFDQTAIKKIHIPAEQLIILLLLTLFAFGSDWFLNSILPVQQETEEETEHADLN